MFCTVGAPDAVQQAFDKGALKCYNPFEVTMGEVFLDALKDTALLLPFLLVMNFLIELIEYRSKGFHVTKILKGRLAPLIATGVGIVPQCGFSVVATELYTKRKIALGSLLAVYIATSDEALPILISNSVDSGVAGLNKLWPVIVIKIAFALAVGYAVSGIEKLYARRKRPALIGGAPDAEAPTGSEQYTPPECAEEHTHADDDGIVHIHGCHRHEIDSECAPPAEGSKKQRAARFWHLYLEHPLVHTGTVALFIFAVNVLFGTVVHYVGDKSIARFMESTGYLQPALAAIVGLIPNCAGSVVITELYVVGGLNLGGAVAGLVMSAGIGYAVLIKENRPFKNTAVIIAVMFVLAVLLGCSVQAVYSLL